MQKHIIRDRFRDIILFLDVNYYGNIVGVQYCAYVELTELEDFMEHDKQISAWVLPRLHAKGMLFFDRDAGLNDAQLDALVDGVRSFIKYSESPELCEWIESEKVVEHEVPLAQKPFNAKAFGQALSNAGFSGYSNF